MLQLDNLTISAYKGSFVHYIFTPLLPPIFRLALFPPPPTHKNDAGAATTWKENNKGNRNDSYSKKLKFLKGSKVVLSGEPLKDP